jgi:hypothetical protein
MRSGSLLGLLLIAGLLLVLSTLQSLLRQIQIPLPILQGCDMWFDVFLEFVGAFEVGGLWLVVDPAILEDPCDIFTEVFPITVFVVGQLLLDGLDVDGLLDHQVVVRHVIDGDWIAEGPGGLVFLHEIQDVLAFQ